MQIIFNSRRTMSSVRLLVDCFYNKTGIRSISREDLKEDLNKQGDIVVRVLDKPVEAPAEREYNG
jgi:hypothetical protein